MSAAPTDAGTANSAGLTPPTRRGRSARLLGEVVVDLGFAEREEVESVVERARAKGKLLGRALVDEGVLTPVQLSRVIAERFGLDHVDLSVYQVDSSVSALLSPATAKRYGVAPIGWAPEGGLHVAMADPAVVTVDDLAMMTGLEIVPVIAPREDIDMVIGRQDRLGDAVETATEDHDETHDATAELLAHTAVPEDEAPVIKLVNSILAQAVELGASDVHFAPHGAEMRVQFRVDGVLTDQVSVPRRLRQGVVTRVKIMADLDIAERRAPQDGRIGLVIDGRPIDVRVVTLPLVGGESLVMRILDRSGVTIGLDDLGMLPAERERFDRAFRKPHGCVLVTGPTGSGKTTTLYGALRALNDGRRSILTIEDPVEYRLDGLRQMQVNGKAGVTFATGLRSMMRADPDIVMVGEIRDAETAQIGVEAALTGHLVLSTLHTNDAPTAITRLIEMGVEPFLVASAVDCVVAQRLARKLCAACRKPRTYTAETLRASGFAATADIHGYEAVGCGRCSQTGYRGRVGLYEVMEITDEIRTLALERGTANAIADVAVGQGMRRLRGDGLVKVLQGETSIAEIARVTGAY